MSSTRSPRATQLTLAVAAAVADVSAAAAASHSKSFGELEIHPFAPKSDDFDEVVMITHDKNAPGRENFWHTDVTWRLKPSLGSILRATDVPDGMGNTLWADMYVAYDSLPDEIKKEIEHLKAVHDFSIFKNALEAKGAPKEMIDAFTEQYPPITHAVVRQHPITGRKSIYVNGAFTQRILGVSRDRSNRLLSTLCKQAAVPEFQCRWQWKDGDVAFWDNRCTQHYAV